MSYFTESPPPSPVGEAWYEKGTAWLSETAGQGFCSLIEATGLRSWFLDIQNWLQTSDVSNNFFAYMFRSIYIELFLNLSKECDIGRAFITTSCISYQQLDAMQKTAEMASYISAKATAITAGGGAAAGGVGAIAAVVPAVPLAAASTLTALCGAGKAVLRPICEKRFPSCGDLKELYI